MDKLTVADKYLLLGYLLRKDRSEEEQQQALEIVRSAGPPEEKIRRLINLTSYSEPLHGLAEEPLRRAHRSPVSRRYEARDLLVLIVDAKQEMLGLLKDTRLGHEIEFLYVTNDIDGLIQLRRYAPAVVILNETGAPVETTRFRAAAIQLRESTRLVVLTAGAHHRHNKPAAGVHYIRKPITIPALEMAIRELAGLYPPAT
jgi:hypothetical protein